MKQFVAIQAGVDMPSLPDETWQGVGLLLFADLSAFCSTASDTLAAWSNPEEGAITARVNPKVHIGFFRNAHINQYVFCGNNPVNFVDPWGLAEWNWMDPSTQDDRAWGQWVDLQGAFTIAAHGTRELRNDGSVSSTALWLKNSSNGAVQTYVTPQQIAEMLLASGSKYKPGQDVYLAGCRTALEGYDGTESIAQQLADILTDKTGKRTVVYGHTGTISPVMTTSGVPVDTRNNDGGSLVGRPGR